jgi:hypothetical protein
MEGFGREGRGANKESMVPGVLRGYRHFRLSIAPPDGTLMSLNDRVPYAPGFQQAKCTRQTPAWASASGEYQDSSHAAPRRKCTCGIYGWYDPRTIDQGFKRGADRVTAVIEVKGKVVMGEKGFRAQAARVVAIALPPAIHELHDFQEQVDLLQSYDAALERYDAKPFRSLGEMARAYPPEDVSALLPEEPEPEHQRGMPSWIPGVDPVKAAALQDSLQAFRSQLLRAAQAAGQARRTLQPLGDPFRPAPGADILAASLPEFESLIAHGPLQRKMWVEPQPMEPLRVLDANSFRQYLTNYTPRTIITSKIDISPMPLSHMKELMERSTDGRYLQATVVVQEGPFIDTGDLMDLGQLAQRTLNYQTTISKDSARGPIRVEIELP